MLADWKEQQVQQITTLGAAREPTADEVNRLILESRESDPVARSATVDLARSVRRLRSESERTRTEPRQILAERELAERRLNIGLVVFDEETGEREQIRLSHREERQFDLRIADALRRTQGSVVVAADAVLADAAGLAAVAGMGADDAHRWLERAVADVVSRSGEWNVDLGAALEQLDQAASTLADAAAGRSTTVPPPPEPPAPPEPSALDLFFERCGEVHERAARHARVDHLPFDAALHSEVIALAPDCASVPNVVSLTPFSSDRNAALAAAMLKNVDDEQFTQHVAEASALLPESAAAQHLRHLYFLATDQGSDGRASLVQAALDHLGAVILDRAANEDFWDRNIEHGALLVSCAEVTVGADITMTALSEAMEEPSLLGSLLLALSETVEAVDSSTRQFLGIRRRFSSPASPLGGLGRSVPASALCAAIERRWPTGPSARGPEVERLAAEFHRYYCDQALPES
jgi:hypothetical protein